MALAKHVDLANGFYAEYWKLGGEPRINRDAKLATFVMAGYKDSDIRHTSDAPVTWHNYEVRNTKESAEFDKFFGGGGDIYQQCYEAAKAKENDDLLHGAKDV
jgi:hypothetical protein